MHLSPRKLGYLAGVITALETCMNVKEDEEVLTVGDTNNLRIAQSFAIIATSLGAESSIIIMGPRATHGNEPPKTVAKAMLGADVVMMPTSTSLTHTDAREVATKNGARIASMPGINEKILEVAMKADYEGIKERCGSLVDKVSNGSKVTITTEKGTNLRLNIKGRSWIADTGILHEPGDFGNLPAGEVYCPPVENEGNGTIIVDTAMAGVGVLSELIRIKFANGRIVSIDGGSEADKLKTTLKEADANAFKIAELGIGANPEVKPMGNSLVDEKIMGTVHIGLGDNLHMGGKQGSKIHLDAVISEPNLELDGDLILRNGKWQI